MQKKSWIILITVVIFVFLFLYFFNPLCNFNRVGSSFPAGDDCNTCSCLVLFGSCTEKACFKPTLDSNFTCPEDNLLDCTGGGGLEGSLQYKQCNDFEAQVWFFQNCPGIKMLR